MSCFRNKDASYEQRTHALSEEYLALLCHYGYLAWVKGPPWLDQLNCDLAVVLSFAEILDPAT